MVPNASDTLGFSTSIVVTIIPPCPMAQVANSEAVESVASLIRLWNVPIGAEIEPPQTCGMLSVSVCVVIRVDSATWCPPLNEMNATGFTSDSNG